MSTSAGLRVDRLSVRFGGLLAVNSVSLETPLGRLTGLIGPNGAGKTTTFNACTGLVRPESGTIQLFGEDVTRQPAHLRAQRGLGRTFQRMELFDSLTVEDNIALGREAAVAGSRPLRHLFARVSENTEVAAATEEAIELCGLSKLRGRRVGVLSTGERRVIELARAIAGAYSVILLDEPSSGLDDAETHRFASVLQELTARRSTGILLVEHDMSLVMSVCEYVYVLDFGELIFEGTPQSVAASETVRAAYLGSKSLEVR